MKNLMPQLQKLAGECNCTVIDDRNASILSIDTNDGWSWDDGERAWSTYPYGRNGSYKPDWRQEAIEQAIKDLSEYPPVNVPYAYGDEE